MARKVIDKDKLNKYIAAHREYWNTWDDQTKARWKAVQKQNPYPKEDLIMHLAVSDIIGGAMSMKAEVTNREIHNIFQILGYDIV